MATTTATQIQQLYVGLLGRAADQGGLNWWADQVTTGGKTLEDVRASFVTSTEYTTTYGAAATRADLVTSIYQNLFERTPSADEVKYWAETDTRPADQLVAAFIEFAGAADQAVINNKTFVAQTYTDTAGTSYNGAAGASVIAGVDGTTASVNAALESITNGTLPGFVPGLNAIAALNAAKAAEVTFGTEIATANPSYDLGVTKDGVVTKAELTTLTTGALAVEKAARDLAAKAGVASVDPAKTTAALIGESAAADALLVTAKAAITSTSAGAKAVATYEAALTAQVAAQGTAAQQLAVEASKNAAIAGLDTANPSSAALWVTLNGKTLAANDIDDAESLYIVLSNKDLLTSERTALVTEVNKLGAFGTQLLAAADKAVSIARADDAVATAKLGVTAASTSAKSDAYTNAVGVAKTAADTLTATQAADVKVAAVQALVDKYTSLEETTQKAADALADLNTDTVALIDLGAKVAASPAVVADVAKSDVFYFGNKVAATTVAEVKTFGAGDSIVIGNSVAYNSGALSTGNSNNLEFFLVKTATGTQVVIETKAFGNASTTVDATGVTSHADAAVITLTGVTADHLSVANGVISYV